MEVEVRNEAAFVTLLEHCVRESCALDKPAMTWQVVGDDAILVGFNQKMVELTGGGIEKALGVSARGWCDDVEVERVLQCDKTQCILICESMHSFRTCDRVMHLISLLHPLGDSQVMLYLYPLQEFTQKG